ncbi:MAG: phosphoribosylamine--glycine ligase [Phycisphaerales bacterium]
MSERINVLLVGGGGREHALAVKLRQSPRLGDLWIANPENPGLAALGKPMEVPVNVREAYRAQQFCEKQNIGLVVVGPEEPLAEGLADKLANERTLVFGPTAEGAQIEANKAWAKTLLRAASVPIADGRTFTDPLAAFAWLAAKVRNDKTLHVTLGPVRDFESEDQKRAFIVSRIPEALAKMPPSAAGAIEAQARAQTVLSLAIAAADTYPVLGDRRKYFDRLVQTDPTIGAACKAPIPNLPVIKASGLAKGKGVVVPSTLAEAIAAIDEIMIKKVHGDAGRELVIEERIEGRELSVLAITDGSTILTLPSCRDHKRLGDGDTGPNTGGMGVICPGEDLDENTMHRIERDILVPTVDALKREGITYRGVLYAGLMLTPSGPKVLEYNCRFGDPECQALMARLDSDLLELLLATCQGRLDEVDVRWKPEPACCIVLASQGYPDNPKKGVQITGVEAASAMPNVFVDHAGTRRGEGGTLVTGGGRVLNVTGLGATMEQARANAYAACAKITFEGKVMRRDIGV